MNSWNSLGIVCDAAVPGHSQPFTLAQILPFPRTFPLWELQPGNATLQRAQHRGQEGPWACKHKQMRFFVCSPLLVLLVLFFLPQLRGDFSS